jgi:hypothetical protein
MPRCSLLLPIGTIAADGFDFRCEGCGADLVCFDGEDGQFDFEYDDTREPWGEDARELGWDHTGKPDGWVYLRPHRCSDIAGAPPC